jgi:hypothetical protein
MAGRRLRGVPPFGVGDTVSVAAGTYVEQVDVDKAITLNGAGSATTRIQAPATLAGKFTTSGVNLHHPIVYVTADATVENLAVDGAGHGSGNARFDGIAWQNAAPTLSNLSIVHVRANPLNGVQSGVGIYGLNSDVTGRPATVTGVGISDFQKNGTVFTGSGLTVNMSNSTVTGAGPQTVIAQNGVQYSSGAGGDFNGNTVSDIECNHSSCGPNILSQVQSGGILLFDADVEGLRRPADRHRLGRADVHVHQPPRLVGHREPGAAAGDEREPVRPSERQLHGADRPERRDLHGRREVRAHEHRRQGGRALDPVRRARRAADGRAQRQRGRARGRRLAVVEGLRQPARRHHLVAADVHADEHRQREPVGVDGGTGREPGLAVLAQQRHLHGRLARAERLLHGRRAAALGGSKANQFTHDQCSGQALAPGNSCTVDVTFTPTARGSLGAQLVITDDAPNSPQKASIKGTGLAS